MLKLSLLCFFIGYSLSFANLFLFYLHMFQLNSYKPNVQIRWMSKNILKLILMWFPALVTIPIIFYSDETGLIFSGLIYLLLAILNYPKKAKKPLVFTARVKRMLITMGILLSLEILLLCLNLNRIYFAIITEGIFFLIPFILLLVNLINKPIELSINKYYINDAKKILCSMPNLLVIGITGSYGKTSTKFFLQKLLSQKYNVLMTPESFNTPLGITKTIRSSLRATHEIFIAEMGAKNTGDIKEICNIVNPKYGIITSIGPQHLESFKTIENVKKTKLELLNAIPTDGLTVINADNEYLQNTCGKNIIGYSIIDSPGATYIASDIKVTSSGSEFTVTANNIPYSFKTKLIGEHNVSNIVGAITLAHQLGVPMDNLQIGVRRLESVPHRLELIRGKNHLIIDDAYNSNPSGAAAALKVLSTFDGIKILVTPGMIELGTRQAECNKEFGIKAAGICDYVALVGSKQTVPIYNGLIESEFPKEKIFVTENLNDAIKKTEEINTESKQKILLLENDLPDNF